MTKITLYQSSNGQVRVWDPLHVYQLRTEYRIVGSLVGTLPPHLPQQTGFFSLPLDLLKEETTLLLDLNIAELVLDNVIHRDPTQNELEMYQEKYQDYLNKYQSHKNELQKKITLAKRQDPSAHVDSIHSQEIPPPILTHTMSTKLPWNCMNEVHSNRENWNYPSTEIEIVTYYVFKEIWKMGFYISRGLKFGGNFLLYPGDPAKFHSNYVASVVLPSRNISALDAVAMGRLGTTVKKTHAICSWTKEQGLLVICIDWTGWN